MIAAPAAADSHAGVVTQLVSDHQLELTLRARQNKSTKSIRDAGELVFAIGRVRDGQQRLDENILMCRCQVANVHWRLMIADYREERFRL